MLVGGKAGELDGVSCGGPSSCISVGTVRSRTMIESWNGQVWSVTKSPTIPGANYAQLLGVSCVGATTCVATGYFSTGSVGENTLVESSNP
ncbi:MAG TPA: hypothetical protein VN796_05705 [Acidimicrobiales bacterium]|nr:hypothetical protein [Acidimicrobiales bacterium]